MEYTKEEFNKVTIQTLKSRGDHISLNAVKMIEEMQEQAINYTRCCESDSELLTSFAEYLKERDILTTKKENIPVRFDLFLKRG